MSFTNLKRKLQIHNDIDHMSCMSPPYSKQTIELILDLTCRFFQTFSVDSILDGITVWKITDLIFIAAKIIDNNYCRLETSSVI